MEEDADLTYLIRSTPLRPDNARSDRRTSLGQQPVDYEVVERLLATIDRLRGERDDVKGHLEFSQVEHRFAVQAFEHRILALSSTTGPDKSLEVSNLEEEIRRLREEANIALAKVEDSQLEAKRSQLAASAFSVVVDRVRANGEYLTVQYGASLRTNEELLSDANRRASVAESRLSEAVRRYDQAEHSCQLLSSRVEELEGVIQQLTQEASQSGDVYRQLSDDLEAAKVTVDHLRKVIQDVEAERDSLNLRVAHLEDDLSTARTEHEDLQGRYQTLQSQQLSSMSSTQANRALRQQIEELEGRVKRRTEQIGLHQHDVRRLETNLRLQEDRIAEMTADIETLMDQKEAMVEDCAEAREARDHAIQRVEALEEQAESFEEKLLVAERERDERDVEVATLVKVMAQGISDKRDAALQLKRLLHFKSEQHRDVQDQLHHAQEHIHSLGQQIQELGSAIASNTQDAMDVDEDPTAAITEDLRQITVALALSRTAYRDAVGSLSLMKGRHASAEACVSSLQQELQALRDHRSIEEDASRVQFQSHINELESTIRGLEHDLQEAKSHQERISQQLTHAQEESRSHAERTEEQALRIAGLRTEIEELNGVQSDQVHELQQQLEEARSELADAVRVRDEVDAEYEKLKEEVDTTKGELNAQLKQVQELSTVRTSLEKELSEIRLTRAEELTRLQEELSKATAAAEKASVEQDTISKERQTAIDELTHTKSELEEKLADTETRFATLQQQFDENSQVWTQSEEKLQDELRFTIERSHKTETDLHRAIRTLEANLEVSSSALETVNEEKDTMESEMTNLEAEIQRYRSLSQYLEKQVKEQ
jgi:chromosome segregation ATPase